MGLATRWDMEAINGEPEAKALLYDNDDEEEKVGLFCCLLWRCLIMQEKRVFWEYYFELKMQRFFIR